MKKEIDGYCPCCGAPHFKGEDEEDHDPSCIWYPMTSSDGADQAFDGVKSTEADNTVGDDRKSSKTSKSKR